MKKRRVLLTVVVLVAVVFGVAGCVTASKTSPQAFEQAVKDIWVRYSKTLMDGDANGYMALWDQGGVQLPPGEPMFMSWADIKKGTEATMASFRFASFAIKISGTFVDQNYGFAYGNYAFTLVAKAGGAEIKGDGKYETIFKRQADGSWKIFRDCFNSNVP